MDNHSSRFWFQRARRWAVSLTASPVSWSEEIDSLEKIAQVPAAVAVPVLLTALTRFVHREQYAMGRIVCGIYVALGQSLRPPVPLYVDLVKGIHSAIVERGSSATQVLTDGFSGAATDPSQKLSILLLLSAIGDERSVPLFDALNEVSIAAMMALESSTHPELHVYSKGHDWLLDARKYIERLRFNFAASFTKSRCE